MRNKTRNLVLCALFTALVTVFAQISIPLPLTPVPINLGSMAVMLCGSLLGKKYGSISILVYIFLGIIGIPVFANLSGGISVLTGPTGGYIASYILVAFIIGLMTEKHGNKLYIYIISFFISIVICYTFGTAWFIVLTKNSLVASLTMCVLPFILGDLLKIIGASFLSLELRAIIKKF